MDEHVLEARLDLAPMPPRLLHQRLQRRLEPLAIRAGDVQHGAVLDVPRAHGQEMAAQRLRGEALNRRYGLGSGTYKPAAMGWQEYRALVLRGKALNAKYGLGYLLMTSQRRGLSEHIILILLIIGTLAYGIDRLLFWFQRGLFPYRVVED